MTPKLTERQIDQGMVWLQEREPQFIEVFQVTGRPTLSTKRSGFSGLLQSIVSQQLSTKAAKTIWNRLRDAGYASATMIRQASDDSLRSVGLSYQKIRYARALAEANINYGALENASTQEVIDTLTPVLGIGLWTAQMYALFALKHPDVFAPNDLGLQEGLRKMMNQTTRPTAREALEISLPWSPWRSVASLALWAFNDQVKTRAAD